MPILNNSKNKNEQIKILENKILLYYGLLLFILTLYEIYTNIKTFNLIYIPTSAIMVGILIYKPFWMTKKQNLFTKTFGNALYYIANAIYVIALFGILLKGI